MNSRSRQVFFSIGSKYSGVLLVGVLQYWRQGMEAGRERDKWMEATLPGLVVRQHAGIYLGQSVDVVDD